MSFCIKAEVAKLADALDSESSPRKGVWVQVPSSAFTKEGTRWGYPYTALFSILKDHFILIKKYLFLSKILSFGL
jgi:hypothetical protein